MDRISTASKAVDLFGAGKHGFKNRNVGLGIDPTDFNAEWPNGVQEELLSIIEAGGIVPDIAVRTQVRQAIKRLFGGNVTTVNFAASPFALTADHAGLVLVDATAGNVVLNLPLANVLAKLPYNFRRVDAAANTATVNRAGANTIDEGGMTSFTLNSQGDMRGIASDGVSTWKTFAASGIGRLINIQKFTAGGVYTPTPGTTSVVVEVQGGGGGGGGSAATGAGQLAAGTGGNGGTYGKTRITSGFAGVTVTVGAGGTAGAVGAAGGTGGTSSFGAFVSAPGGAGGSGSPAVAPPAMIQPPTNSAIASGGTLVNTSSATAGQGTLLSTSYARAGDGGASLFGFGPTGANGPNNGGLAANFGTGGSGALTGASSAGFTGGAGAPGVVIVYEYA